MATRTLDADAIMAMATPQTHQHAHELQPYGHLVRMPIALSAVVSEESVTNLNQILADTITLRDMYKKHHWQIAGPTFYQLHLLYDKHATEQGELVDSIAERVQLLGGVTLAIVLLIPRTKPPWQIAFHRFAEVSIGIGVALIFAWVWPEEEATPSGEQIPPQGNAAS